MTIEAAGIPGACSVWADPMYDGPVPGGLTDAELIEVRTRHLASGEPDRVNDLREWRNAIARHESYDELILWYEHDLFDQLNLIQLLTWIRAHLPEAKPVTLICIGSFPGRPDFKGLGELSTDELAPLLHTRQPVGDAQYALAERAWTAFREPTPEALERLRRSDTSALPYLAAAITRFLEEYPWTRDGLSRAERRLLELAGGGPIPLAQVFPRMHDGETAYYTADLSLLDMVDNLSTTAPPLLAVDAPAGSEDRPFRRTITLTDAGRSVLGGRLDRVTACGIDRWLGGVHLQGSGPLWRWDDAGQRVTRS